MIGLKQIFTLIFPFIFFKIFILTDETYVENDPSNPLCLRGAPSVMNQYMYTKNEFDEIKNYLVIFSFFIGKYKDYFSFEDVIRYLVGSDGIFKDVNWAENHDFGVVFVMLEDYINDADKNNDKIISFCEFYDYEKNIRKRKIGENRLHELCDRIEDLYVYYNLKPQ